MTSIWRAPCPECGETNATLSALRSLSGIHVRCASCKTRWSLIQRFDEPIYVMLSIGVSFAIAWAAMVFSGLAWSEDPMLVVGLVIAIPVGVWTLLRLFNRRYVHDDRTELLAEPIKVGMLLSSALIGLGLMAAIIAGAVYGSLTLAGG